MPLISNPTYFPPALFRNGHFNTIYSNLFRRVEGMIYERVRITTSDDDFIDLDFSSLNSKILVLILHGLEGSSGSGYMKGMTKAVNNAGWDAVSVNLRGCSGEDNCLLTSYHSGKTDDLEFVIRYIGRHYNYEKILITGFSLGGNIALKYAGEQGEKMSPQVGAIAGVSVPCDLGGSAVYLKRRSNRLYLNRFIRSLKKKALLKKVNFPEAPFTEKAIRKVKDFNDFDNLFTAPVNGYIDAKAYWEDCSSKKYLKEIRIPSLLINAADDPFISPSSYPVGEAGSNPHFWLEVPVYGGHVGFANDLRMKRGFYHETRIIEFFQSCL